MFGLQVRQNISVKYIKEMDEKGEIRRNLNRTAQKDTLAVPSGGFAILRFHANNPGKSQHQQHLSKCDILAPYPKNVVATVWNIFY